MLPRAVRLVTLVGVPVRVDPWLLPLGVAAVWLVARRGAIAIGWPTAIAMAVAVVVGLLVSILAHELAHALEARHRGVGVEDVTLLVVGGATTLRPRDRGPTAELAIAAIGPWTSLVVAAVAGLVATVAGEVLPVAVARPVGAVAGALGWANLVLALTNLVPAWPLDGGVMLRALLWRWTGDRRLATRVVTALGSIAGVVLVTAGVWSGATGRGSPATAVVAVVVGLFLAEASRLERRRARVVPVTELVLGDAIGGRAVDAPADPDHGA